MNPTLTEEQLLAMRARRLGKPVPGSNDGVPSNAGGGPDAPRIVRAPTGEIAAPDFLGDGGQNTDPQPASNNATPAQSTEELEQLRQQLAAANGRLGPVQRQAEEFKSALEAQQRQIAELQAQLAEQQAVAATRKAQEAAAAFDPFEGMSKEEIELLDPTAAELIRKAARNAYSKAASQVKDPEEIIRKTLAERDARQLQAYLRSAADSIGLTKLASDARFQKFVEEDGGANYLLSSFMQAADIDIARSIEADVRKLVNRYKKSTGADSRAPDPQDQLSQHLSRTPGGASGARPSATSPEDVKRITERVRQLSRQGKHKEASELLASINN